MLGEFRKVERDDLKKLFELKKETQNSVNGIFIKTFEEQLQWYENTLKSNETYPLIYEIDGKSVGFFLVRDIDWICRHNIFSYYLFSESRGKGFGKSLLSDGLEFCFNVLNMEKVYGEVLKDNIISAKIMKSCGFSLVGIRKNHVFKNGNFIDVLHYEILKNEWRKI
jgi:RimJ/RimL family protein N-acetyltransferase